jgi:hypothetical protein
MAATTATAKLRKRNNRISKRDIEREVRIAQKGGQPIEVFYGKMLHKEDRAERMKVELMLNYPILDAIIKNKQPAKRSGRRAIGSLRTEKNFITGVLQSAKVRAKALGLPFNIDVSALSIPSVCPIFGTPLVWTDAVTNDTPSLDRLVPEKGYVTENVAFISMRANRIKSDASLAELERIVEWMKQQA